MRELLKKIDGKCVIKFLTPNKGEMQTLGTKPDLVGDGDGLTLTFFGIPTGKPVFVPYRLVTWVEEVSDIQVANASELRS